MQSEDIISREQGNLGQKTALHSEGSTVFPSIGHRAAGGNTGKRLTPWKLPTFYSTYKTGNWEENDRKTKKVTFPLL